MSANVTWKGLDAYQKGLDVYPQDVADAARPIIERRARIAFQAVHDGYPVKSGTLQRGLDLKDTSPSDLHPEWTLRNATVYAKIFEAGGMTTLGPKPAGRVFAPITARQRTLLRFELADLLGRVRPRG